MKEIRDEGIKLKDGNREGTRGRELGRGSVESKEVHVNRLDGGGENQVMRSEDKRR